MNFLKKHYYKTKIKEYQKIIWDLEVDLLIYEDEKNDEYLKSTREQIRLIQGRILYYKKAIERI